MLLPGPLVDAEWLAINVDAVDIADVRWSIPTGPKAEAFADGHLPGAVFVDLDADLSDPPGPRGRHPLPPLDRFRRNIADLGLGRRPVICYDDTSGATAARLWWMLDAIGHPVAVLDGGIGAWTGPLQPGSAPHSRPAVSDTTPIGDPSIVDWPASRMVDVGQILACVGGGSALLDARSAERFRGEPSPVDPVLGHIPGGRSRPWTDNISDDGLFRQADHLRRELTELGVGEPGKWLASCGSGITACHNLLAARVAGLGDGRLYAGSWSEWISDPSRPIETGASNPVTPPGTDEAG